MTQPPYQQPYQAPAPYPQQQDAPQHPQGHRQTYQAPPAGYGYGRPPAPQQGYGQPQGQAYQQPQAYQGHPQGYPQGHPQGSFWPQGYQQAPQQPEQRPQAPVQATPGSPVVACRICGSAPAARVTFRGVTGALIMHTFYTSNGPFCRDCGLHIFRQQTSRTLAGGWCSVGALVATPIFLLLNVIAKGKVTALPAPQPYMAGQTSAPLDPGKPVFERPLSYLYPALAFFLLAFVIVSNLVG